MFLFFFKQKTAYEMRISDWSSDVCSSDLDATAGAGDDRHLALKPIRHFSAPLNMSLPIFHSTWWKSSAKGTVRKRIATGVTSAHLAAPPRMERGSFRFPLSITSS